jgi:hypothetical protein
MWKHAQVISILKPGKNPALPSSYRSIILLDTTGKIFVKILLARILHEVGERGLLGDEQFGFRRRHSTSLQLARLVERITRNFGERRLTGAIFLVVAKAFDTVWIDGLIYKLMQLLFPSYIVHTISSYLRGRTFETSIQMATSSRRTARTPPPRTAASPKRLTSGIPPVCDSASLGSEPRQPTNQSLSLP